MLEVFLRNVSFSYPRGSFALRDVSISFAASEHTAIVGPPACGVTTLLRIVAGILRPDSGEILIGNRIVNDVKSSRRPLLFSTAAPDVPGRWSVQHALIAAARTRSLDRVDRQAELRLAASRWSVDALLDQRVDQLSGSEATRLQLARIELMRPAILVCDRLFERTSASIRDALADEMHRVLRVMGATVISGSMSFVEPGLAHSVVVLHEGRVVQRGAPADLYATPALESVAAALGKVNVIPANLKTGEVESAIGYWRVDPAPFEGPAMILIRPEEFHLVPAGQESDFVFGIEEARFVQGRWEATGYLSGGVRLQVSLPAGAEVHKGKLIPLRFEPSRARLLQRREEGPAPGRIGDFIPSMKETR